jgi:hypothetical protein
MLVAMPDLHRAMQGNPVPEQVLQWMTDVSGLPVSLIGKLYRMGPVSADEGRAGALEIGGAGARAAADYDDDTAVADEWSAGR